jgi:hypothetical protein
VRSEHLWDICKVPRQGTQSVEEVISLLLTSFMLLDDTMHLDTAEESLNDRACGMNLIITSHHHSLETFGSLAYTRRLRNKESFRVLEQGQRKLHRALLVG